MVDRSLSAPPGWGGAGWGGRPSPDTIVPPAGGGGPLVSKEMRLFTRDGCPRIGDVAGETVEAWSGNPTGGWVRVTPRPWGPPEGADFYRVRLDDGRCLTCAGAHPWPVVAGGRIRPVATEDLRTDYPVAPFIQFPPGELGGAGERAGRAYELGGRLGAKMALRCQGGKRRRGLPPWAFALPPPALARFVAGWLDAQNGILFGPKGAIGDLQLLLHRLGVHRTLREDRGRFCALALSAEDAGAIPNPRGLPREYRRIASALPRIVEVCALGEKRRAYALEVEGAHTVVVGGVIALC